MRKTSAAALGVGLAAVAIGSAAAQGAWRVGMTVLGSPAQIESGYKRCEVMGGANSAGYYDLECANSFLDPYNKKQRRLQRTWVPGKWIKPNDPSFEPDMQVAAIRGGQGGAAAATAPPRPVARPNAGAGGSVQPGQYQCYGGPAGNMKLSFRGGGQYANEQGKPGAYTQSGPTVTFRSGPWAGFYGYVFPDGRVQLRTAPDRPSSMECERR